MMMFDVGPVFALGMIPVFALGMIPVFAMGMIAEGGSPLLQVVPFVLIFAIFYFIILLPSKRKQQKVQEFLDNLKVNDKVITTSGMFGQILRLDEQSVQLQVADKVNIKVSKAAIGGYQGQPPVVETTNP